MRTSALRSYAPGNVTVDTEFFLNKYPACGPDSAVPVKAAFTSREGAASALRLTFGPSMWLALIFHAIATEYYVSAATVVFIRMSQADLARSS